MKKAFFFLLLTSSLILILSSCGHAISDSIDIDPDKYYSIVSVNSGKCLDVGTNEIGSDVFQCNCNHSDKQKFVFLEDENEDGFYIIVNKFSKKQMDIYGASIEDGCKVIQWDSNNGDNQKFSLIQVSHNRYNIISKLSKKVLDVKGQSKEDSVPLIQWSPNGQQNQIFELRVEE